MSREKQTKKEMRSELDNLLEATGLGADFLSKKEKKEFIKDVQDMGETLPPKEFHTGHSDYKYAFSGDWGNVDLKLAELPNSFKELNNEQRESD